MGKNWRKGAIIFTIVVGGIVTTAFAGTGTEPGSVDDPLVTKSYVDSLLTPINTQIEQTKTDLTAKIDTDIAKVNTDLTNKITALEETDQGFTDKITKLEEESKAITERTTKLENRIQEVGVGGYAPIQVVELQAGEILLGGAGTEIIVRNGQTIVYGSGINGIPDTTQGVDLAIGKLIPTNHLLLIPREDGRGIQVKKDFVGIVYVMVRGPYQVVK